MRDLTRHVLITQAHMQRFNGSEIVTLELIEFFLKQNSQVTLLTHALGEPVLSQLENLQGLTVFQGVSGEVDKALKSNPPTLAWIHHGVIPKWLLEEGLDVPIVFNHMSSQVAIEFPIVIPFESEISSVSLFNARKIMEDQLGTGLFAGMNPERIQLFENPAPDNFRKIKKTINSGLPRVAVISNHIPTEIYEMCRELKHSYVFSLVGNETDLGAVPQRITPEFLDNFDAVITIGKTVQYALVAGIPVYCYDHFGGPGWITKENIDSARFDNFSGRGFSKKEISELSNDFLSGFEVATDVAQQLAASIENDLTISKRIANLLRFIEANPKSRKIISEKSIQTYLYIQGSIAHYVRAWVLGTGTIHALEETKNYLLNQLDDTQNKLNRLKRITGYSFLTKLWRK